MTCGDNEEVCLKNCPGVWATFGGLALLVGWRGLHAHVHAYFKMCEHDETW